jgi:biopolymer transport protein ExbD
MKNTKSGWSGKIRVSAAIIVSLLLSILVLQCNSNLENSMTSELESQKLSQESLSVPILPQSPYKINYDPENVLNLAVKDGKLYVDDTHYPLNQLAAVIEKSGLNEHAAVKFKVEGSQSMGFVRDVQDELRKADKRKILYIGVSEEGETVELAMLLPPMPNSTLGIQLPVINEQYLKENNMDVLKIQLGDNAGVENQKAVHDFVLDRLANERNYVVSAKFDDTDTYEVYLSNLLYIHEGFNQIYDERSQKLFGKRWWDIAYNLQSEGELREQYNAVRQGIPRAISIAEN